MPINEIGKNSLGKVAGGAAVEKPLPEGTKYVFHCSCCGEQWMEKEGFDLSSLPGCPKCGRYLKYQDNPDTKPEECVTYFKL